MRRTIPILAMSLLVALCCQGCERLPADAPAEEGLLTFTPETLQDGIPADYGDLVAVTANETFPGWAQLWFQREDRSVVAVYVQYAQKRLAPRALLIPRS